MAPETESAAGGAPPSLRPSADVVSRRLDDEVVLVHLRTNRIYSLNETGARLWELLETGHDRVRIERQMLEEFDVEPADLRREIAELLGSLEAEQLVHAEAAD